ncbi:unnamed protein product, partial [marine sediment metagenome]
ILHKESIESEPLKFMLDDSENSPVVNLLKSCPDN